MTKPSNEANLASEKPADNDCTPSPSSDPDSDTGGSKGPGKTGMGYTRAKK